MRPINQAQISFSSHSVNEGFGRAAVAAFLAQLDLPVTTMVYIEGSLSRDYSVYHLTQGCKSRIWQMYREEPAGG